MNLEGQHTLFPSSFERVTDDVAITELLLTLAPRAAIPRIKALLAT